MTTRLLWRPLPEAGSPLPESLKKILSHKIWQSDGELYCEWEPIGHHMLLYLEGLRDAGVAGAEDLIDLIKVHKAVELAIEGD